MKSSAILSGEVVDHKIAAVFESSTEAENIALALREGTSLAADQVIIVSPENPRSARALEPESQGIWSTLVRSHIGLGMAGAIAGFILFSTLYSADVAFITQSLVVSAIVLTAIGGGIGLLLAGMVTLRPDHMPYLMLAQSALRKGKYVLTVHASSAQQLDEAKKTLRNRRVSSVRSF
ncbi:MAG: hypothetical protein WD623_14860 [Marinobacter sp.]|uniref:hypothetical protein n=1 Tax=Marinobacter sp. TaxID=50741 RepID=UPI0034A09110